MRGAGGPFTLALRGLPSHADLYRVMHTGNSTKLSSAKRFLEGFAPPPDDPGPKKRNVPAIAVGDVLKGNSNAHRRKRYTVKIVIVNERTVICVSNISGRTVHLSKLSIYLDGKFRKVGFNRISTTPKSMEFAL